MIMLLKLKIVDRFSLRPVIHCKVELVCPNNNLKHECNGELEVNLPKECIELFVNIAAPMYKDTSLNIYNKEKNNERVIGLEIIDLLEDDPVTA